MYMTVKKLYNELIRIGGQAFTLEMHRRFGGELIMVVSRKAQWYKAIEELIGVDAANEFYNKYHDQISMYVGKLDRLLSGKRNERIKAEYKKGVNCQILARKYNLSAVYIRRIVQHHPVRDRRDKCRAEREKTKVSTANTE